MIRLYDEREEARDRALWRRLIPRETIGTLLLGTLSVALAVVMLLVIVLGLFAKSLPPWNEPRSVMVEAVPRQFITTYDSDLHRNVRVPLLVSSRRIWVPSTDCHRLVWLGLVFGAVGIAMSLRRREWSWLSAIGFALMLLSLNIVVACEALMTLKP
jgi:hypothetical protein